MLTIAFLVAIAQSTQKEKSLPYLINQKQLDNGLNVVTVPKNSLGLADFYIVVWFGSRK